MALSQPAEAALSLVVNEANADQISFTLSGTFDTAPIGDQPMWLAIKPDWSVNTGQNVPWISDSAGFTQYSFAAGLSVITDTVAFSGLAITEKDVAASGQQWGDSIYFKTSVAIPAGTAVSGTLTIHGTGMFDVSGIHNFQLVSGFNNAQQDFQRLEASTAIPEPAMPMLILFGACALVAGRSRH